MLRCLKEILDNKFKLGSWAELCPSLLNALHSVQKLIYTRTSVVHVEKRVASLCVHNLENPNPVSKKLYLLYLGSQHLTNPCRLKDCGHHVAKHVVEYPFQDRRAGGTTKRCRQMLRSCQQDASIPYLCQLCDLILVAA